MSAYKVDFGVIVSSHEHPEVVGRTLKEYTAVMGAKIKREKSEGLRLDTQRNKPIPSSSACVVGRRTNGPVKLWAPGLTKTCKWTRTGTISRAELPVLPGNGPRGSCLRRLAGGEPAHSVHYLLTPDRRALSRHYYIQTRAHPFQLHVERERCDGPAIHFLSTPAKRMVGHAVVDGVQTHAWTAAWMALPRRQ